MGVTTGLATAPKRGETIGAVAERASVRRDSWLSCIARCYGPAMLLRGPPCALSQSSLASPCCPCPATQPMVAYRALLRRFQAAYGAGRPMRKLGCYAAYEMLMNLSFPASSRVAGVVPPAIGELPDFDCAKRRFDASAAAAPNESERSVIGAAPVGVVQGLVAHDTGGWGKRECA